MKIMLLRKILKPAEVAKYLIITFLVLIANSVTFVFINPLIYLMVMICHSFH
ncbi:hypothetical protein UM715_07600 [Staphylococcus aureus]|nr:hypothetical protein UM715_07600 [Staphylococcus aureus]